LIWLFRREEGLFANWKEIKMKTLSWRAKDMTREIDEPFCVGRDVSRLLFDFSILISCITETDNPNVLDFAGGSGWVAEYLNRAGFNVTSF
jgi:hypothetical protein